MDCPELEGIVLVEIDLTDFDEEDHEQIDIREELEDQHRMYDVKSRCFFVWP